MCLPLLSPYGGLVRRSGEHDSAFHPSVRRGTISTFRPICREDRGSRASLFACRLKPSLARYSRAPRQGPAWPARRGHLVGHAVGTEVLPEVQCVLRARHVLRVLDVLRRGGLLRPPQHEEEVARSGRIHWAGSQSLRNVKIVQRVKSAPSKHRCMNAEVLGVGGLAGAVLAGVSRRGSLRGSGRGVRGGPAGPTG